MSDFNNWFGVRFPNIQATIDQTNDQESKLLKLCCKEVWQSKQAEIDSLKTQLAVYKDDMRKDVEKIGELQKRVDLTLNIITDIKKAGIEMEKTPNVRKVGMVLINFMGGLEIALRGANDYRK